MKFTFVFAALLATSLMAQAETLRVNVPFAFTVSGTQLPAGDYKISTLSGSSPILSIQGKDADAMVFGRVVTEKAKGKPAVMFNKTSLVGVTAAGHTFEFSVRAEPGLRAATE